MSMLWLRSASLFQVPSLLSRCGAEAHTSLFLRTWHLFVYTAVSPTFGCWLQLAL